MCKFCDDQCSCHLNPPCGFCTSHIYCEICGQQVCEDLAEEILNNSDGSKLLLCHDCYNTEVD